MTETALNGFSCSLDSLQAVDDMIAAINRYGANCFRIAFNPPWTSGTRPWGASATYDPSGVDKVNYFLSRCSHNIIVDRVHDTDNVSMPLTGALRSWATVEQLLFDDVLAYWGNNPRVVVEIINEYPNSEMYPICEGIVQRIRQAGYTNRILLNKHNIAGAFDWLRFKAETPSLDYYGKHWYFDEESQYTYYANAIQHMTWALEYGCTPLCNTEVGPSYRGLYSFNVENVARLNSFLVWCHNRGIGNMVWMNHDLSYLQKFESLGFTAPWLFAPVYRTLSYQSTPISVDAVIGGVQVPSGSVMQILQGETVTLRVPRTVNV